MTTSYVTTPIYYVNDVPHIGHIYTTVVADAVARYLALAGADVRFLTGTDEHGQKIERAAQREGVAPIELADRVVEAYHQSWRRFGIGHHDFLRTTEARHRRGVERMIERIAATGDFYVAAHEGWYCAECETFYTEKELAPGNHCPDHGIPAEWRSEENVFFRLSRYQDALLEWYGRDPSPVRPESRANEVRSFVESGLKDLSVSRSNLSWGIPFPGHEDQTVYVWLDALTNYVSALGFGGGEDELYRRFWAGEGRRIHLIGKDILRFHAVYWPAFLMSAGLPLPTEVWAHGWWLRDQRKVSKSVGNIVRPEPLVARFGADPVRFFLLRAMVFGRDASYSDEEFVDRYNSDLANDLGNTLSRLVRMSRQTFDGRTPPEACGSNPLIAAAERAVAGYRDAMDELAFHRALSSLWELLAEVNQYLVAREPWKLAKTEGATPRVSRVLWNGLEALRIVATCLLPVMPEVAPRILRNLGIEQPPESFEVLAWGGTPLSVEIPPARPLFPRVDREAYLAGEDEEEAATPVGAAEADEEREMTIDIEKFFETELRVATVVAAERVPDTDKLVQLRVDLGEEEPRTLVAGIAQQYEAESLVGRQVVVVANLKPAKLRGIVSQGMVLAASVDGSPVLLAPDQKVPVGTRVR
ncbi:MAG: methionine--tRNA ligase [Thermoanaerobaculia bacterium]|nr:methionine--tRNA ligase [Thermoanaerobaculia bacterium]